MESRYQVLADVIKATDVSVSFHLAEENKEDFPHDYVSIYRIWEKGPYADFTFWIQCTIIHNYLIIVKRTFCAEMKSTILIYYF